MYPNKTTRCDIRGFYNIQYSKSPFWSPLLAWKIGDFASNAPGVFFVKTNQQSLWKHFGFPMDSCDCLQTNSGETKRLAGRLIFPYINHMSNKKTRLLKSELPVLKQKSVSHCFCRRLFLSVSLIVFVAMRQKWMDFFPRSGAPHLGRRVGLTLTHLPSRLTGSNHPWIFPGRIPGEREGQRPT